MKTATKVFIDLSLAIACLGCSWFANPARAQQTPPLSGNYREEVLLVKIMSPSAEKDALAALSDSIHQQIGAEVMEEYPLIKEWKLVRLPQGMTVAQAQQAYQTAFARCLRESSDSLADKAAFTIVTEPDGYITLPQQPAPTPSDAPVTAPAGVTPNDPLYPQQTSYKSLQASAAWAKTTGSDQVVVVIMDTGVNYSHPDLKDNMWQNEPEAHGQSGIDDDGNGIVDDIYGYDSYNDDGDPMDDNGHGTHCAGVMGAVGNNGTGVAGVNWKVKMMAIKLLGDKGRSTVSQQMGAFQYVALMKDRGVNIRVTNNSWTNAPGNTFIQGQKDAIDELGKRGILNCFAAGNDASNNDVVPSYPASYQSPSIVSVAAAGADDGKASFSNFGKKTVHLAAPGESILSTNHPSGYSRLSGTSMATPYVSGAVALMASLHSGLTGEQLKSRLLEKVDKLPAWSEWVSSGGRLNLAKALEVPDGSPGNAVAGPASGQLLFSSKQDNDWDIYLMNADGSDLKPLTSNDFDDCNPAASPDGRTIVFVFNRDGNPVIYRMNRDGTDQKKLAMGAAGEGYPSWVSVPLLPESLKTFPIRLTRKPVGTAPDKK